MVWRILFCAALLRLPCPWVLRRGPWCLRAAQQIISVDYRALKNSDTAMALKQQVLPPALKEFEIGAEGRWD